jgi:hypothetical protein
LQAVALDQQRLCGRVAESTGKAVAEIELRRVAAALAEIALGLARDPRLFSRARRDSDAGLRQQLFEGQAGDRIVMCN